MIANFSSLIELSAAIYVTMCLDSDKFKAFWNPNREAKVAEIGLQSTIDKAILKTRTDEILSLRRMGLFMISICFLFLFLSGFEDSMSKDEGRWTVPFIFSSGVVFVIELFHRAIFTKIKYVVIAIVIIIICFIYLWFNTRINRELQYDLLTRIHEFSDLIVGLVIVFPIVSHIFHLWIHSSVYSGYLNEIVKGESEEYHTAVSALSEGRPSKTSKRYRKAWDLVKNPKDPDPDITPFTELYTNSVVKALYPSEIKLLWSFFLHWIKLILTWGKSKIMRQT